MLHVKTDRLVIHQTLVPKSFQVYVLYVYIFNGFVYHLKRGILMIRSKATRFYSGRIDSLQFTLCVYLVMS